MLEDVSDEADGSVVLRFGSPSHVTVRLNADQRRTVTEAVTRPPFHRSVGGLGVSRADDVEENLYLHAQGWALMIHPEAFDDLLQAVADRDRPPGMEQAPAPMPGSGSPMNPTTETTP